MCPTLAHNGLQLGAVCVGLWEGNCAKVLLYLVCFFLKGRKEKFKICF